MPLVFMSTDASSYDWKDITGVQYHYPNGYRNLIRSGVPFVYYRGIRRADGSRGPAEYFGRGVVGSIWRDPDVPEDERKGRWAWYCAVEEYMPFTPPVPAKIDGRHLEPIQRKNAWRDGVRVISENVYQEILALAGQQGGTSHRTLPPVEDVSITQVPIGTLLVPQQLDTSNDKEAETETTTRSGRRYSRSAKLIGDRAEEIVLRWLATTQPSVKELRWVAQEGETPGWDIQFIDAAGALVAVEVKGSTGQSIANFEVTSNELLAMRGRRSNYWLILVADCLGKAPLIEVLVDPASLLDMGLIAEPIRWRIARSPAVEERGLSAASLSCQRPRAVS
jgi:hypothetical protein